MTDTRHRHPRSKAGQLSEILRQRIEGGDWVERLPSERSLASEYGVSRSCLRAALDLLGDDGTLAPAERSKPRRIQTAPISTGQSRSLRKVMFLTPAPNHESSPTLLGQLASLRHLLASSNLSVEETRNRSYQHPATPEGALERMIKKHPDSIWILHQSPASVQEWFAKKKLPALIFGSAFPGIKIPAIDVDFKSSARHATGRLLTRGHQRIAILLHRSELAGDHLIIDGVQEALAAHSGPTSPPLLLANDLNRDRLKALLDKSFLTPDRPTALLVHNEHHLLTAFTHLLQHGLTFPKDLSFVSMVNDSAIERLCPLPDRYHVGDRLIRALAKGVISLLNGERVKSQSLLPEHLKGETVGAPPTAANS